MSAKVTAEMVKELRERTGVGMGKCKEALDKVGGDMEKAIDYLRKTGMASAVKKEGRETNEGMIGAFEGPSGDYREAAGRDGRKWEPPSGIAQHNWHREEHDSRHFRR